MEIKPRFNTSTMTIARPAQRVTLESRTATDPSGSISSGIFKVIKWEQIRQKITIFISLAVLISMLVLIALYSTIFPAGWLAFVIPIVVGLTSLYKLSISLIEKKWLTNAITKYREDLKFGISNTPPFVTKLYVELHKKQISHNWATFFILFNGGIITLLLWWLKDASWWIFEFDKWISHLFSNPTMMTWVFTIVLIFVSVLHIVMAIQRRKRILEIDSYVGTTIVSQADLEVIKVTKNKFYRRLFILWIMAMLIIPIVVKLILRVMRGRRK